MPNPDLERVLEVQERDTVLDQLRHRRLTLPARAELEAAAAQRARLEVELTEARAARDEVAGRLAGFERELAAVEARTGEVEKRMYSGEVSASRELQAMADEVASLGRRRSGLEDQALEAMEEREPLDTRVAELEGALADLEREAEQHRQAITVGEAEIDAELERETAAREEAAAGLPAPLAAEYEKLRARLGGVGAARLAGSSCSGCHLTLPSTELDRIKHLAPDAVAHCEQCGRILVP